VAQYSSVHSVPLSRRSHTSPEVNETPFITEVLLVPTHLFLICRVSPLIKLCACASNFLLNPASQQCFKFTHVWTYYHKYITFCKILYTTLRYICKWYCSCDFMSNKSNKKIPSRAQNRKVKKKLMQEQKYLRQGLKHAAHEGVLCGPLCF